MVSGRSVLEELMTSYAKLQEQIGDQPYVATSPPRKRPKPTNPYECIREGCKCKDFEIDQRRGNRVCVGCGCVQNGFSLMMPEPEKRNFDDGPDHRRTERLREGESGTGGGPAALKYAAARAESTTEISAAVKARQQRYVGCLRKLADEIEPFSSVMLESAVRSVRDLAIAVDDHWKKCKCAGCRLRKTPQNAFLVVAAVIRRTAQHYKLSIEYSDLQVYLERIGENHSARKIRQYGNIGIDILKGYEEDCYGCDANAEIRTTDAPKLTMLDRITQGATRVCEVLFLPYPTQVRIHDVLKAWNARGFASSTTSAIAAAAVWSVVKNEGVELEAVAKAAGCSTGSIYATLKKHA